MDQRDTGKIRKIGEDWFVFPDNLPFRKIELHPNDVKLMKRGFCLTPIRGLMVEFEIKYIQKVRSRRLKRSLGPDDFFIYALIVQQN